MAWIGACAFALGIGCYFYLIASNKCIKGSLFSISRRTEQNISDQFIEFIQFHSRVKQLSANDKIVKIFSKKLILNLTRWLSNYSDIIQPILMILFIWGLVTICGAFLMIQVLVVECFSSYLLLIIWLWFHEIVFFTFSCIIPTISRSCW